MKLTFHGAAGTVTGSRHLVEIGGARVLLDCGLVQGPRRESEARNRTLGFDPKSIDAVVLSHAHIDHSGVLPALVKQGFDGNIFCTPATGAIANAMLADSAAIQVSDMRHLNGQRRPSEPPLEPLYTPEDARETARRMVSIPYGREVTIFPGISVSFADAGHILGSAVVTLAGRDRGGARRVVFTGDIGRKSFPILRDPKAVPQGEVFITESTYGDRDHGGTAKEAKEHLLEVAKRTAARRGRLIVPAFALGRAQTLTYLLHELWLEKRLDPFPIFVDSPLSIEVTSVYRMHPDCFDAETLRYLDDGVDGDPFRFGPLTYLRSSDDSRTLNDRKGPFLVIAASGMCEGGRILHHLRHGVGDPANTLLLVGYCARNTLGRRLADGADRAKIFGVEYPVRCEVVRLDGLSQHAGRGELLDYAATQRKASAAFCVHGEPEALAAMTSGMKQAGFSRVEVPALGQTFDV
jgi:metallo-beta-lactamase family protein